jgi:hypothetical protein
MVVASRQSLASSEDHLQFRIDYDLNYFRSRRFVDDCSINGTRRLLFEANSLSKNDRVLSTSADILYPGSPCRLIHRRSIA